MAGISIPFLANVRGFLRGTGDVNDALDDVADALDDVAREATDASRDASKALDAIGDAGTDAGKDIADGSSDASKSLSDVAEQASKTGNEIEQKLEGAGDAAASSADKVEKKFRDALDAVSTKAKSTGDDIEAATSSGTARGGEAVSEFKSEAVSNFSEVASSFSGDMTSAVDGVQGLLGGLAGSSIPGVGIAAGALAIVMGSTFASAQEEAEKTRERIDRIKEAFADTETATEAVDEVWREKIAEWADPMTVLGDSIVDARKQIQGLGFDGEETDTIIRGIAGAPADIQKAQKLLTDEIGRTDKAYRDSGVGVDIMAGRTDKHLNKLKSELEKTVKISEQATEEYQAQEDIIRNAPGWIGEAAKAQDKYLESLTKDRTIKVDVDLTDAKRAVAAWRPSVDVTVNQRRGKQVP